MKMFAYLTLIVLILMAAPAPASATVRNFTLTIGNYASISSGSVYVYLPWEMCGLTSSPPNQSGVWSNGWNVGTVYTVDPGSTATVIPLSFALSSKSTHVLRMSRGYVGAQQNSNDIACQGLPVTVTSTYPSDIYFDAGYQDSPPDSYYYCYDIYLTP